MRKFIIYFIGLLGTLMLTSEVHAEYRAYELEIFDQVEKKREIIVTSFSPNDYILSNGGPQRVSVVIRASWICYGDTSKYQKVCPTPEPVNPRYKVGERVQILLQRHVAHQWTGVIENSFFRPDLKSNVYGVRFPNRKNLYTRFYEANLQKAP
jgi:hypothetical protein